jgi:hypothetical protein
MKWIKASERLPLDVGNVRHVKIEGTPSMGNFYDGDNGKLYFGKTFGHERHIEQKDFHLIEWLDESICPELAEEIERLKAEVKTAKDILQRAKKKLIPLNWKDQLLLDIESFVSDETIEQLKSK